MCSMFIKILLLVCLCPCFGYGFEHRIIFSNEYHDIRYRTTRKPVLPSRSMINHCVLTHDPPDPSGSCCGIDSSGNNRIVGGTATSLDQYPWLVLIDYRLKRDNKTISYMCGGSLISGRYVLTAAHCVVGAVLTLGQPVSVRLGEYNTTHAGPDCSVDARRQCDDGVTNVEIEEIIVHPDHYHDNHTNNHDLALIRLKDTVRYTNYIRPICLPSSDVSETTRALHLTAAGWGAVNQFRVFDFINRWHFENQYDGVKRDVNLPYRDVADCKDVYKSVNDWDTKICAGGTKDKDACRGDSGGPLMHDKDGVYEVAAVVSFGHGQKACGTENVPGVYTNVFKYIDWIKKEIRP